MVTPIRLVNALRRLEPLAMLALIAATGQPVPAVVTPVAITHDVPLAAYPTNLAGARTEILGWVAAEQYPTREWGRLFAQNPDTTKTQLSGCLYRQLCPADRGCKAGDCLHRQRVRHDFGKGTVDAHERPSRGGSEHPHLGTHARSIPEWMWSQWPLFTGMLLITIAGTAALAWPRGRRWVLLPFGGLWALPAAWVWMGTAYVTPPATQYSTGKCGFVAAGCLLMPGAVIIAMTAAGLGVLAVAIPLLIVGIVWGRLRRPA